LLVHAKAFRMTTLRLTMAQALVRYLAAQRTELDGGIEPLFAGVWAIFGHGNVAALGEALWRAHEVLPTFRAHNEQAMGHAAIAFAKASRRQRMMACTSSIGPGATNMVTAAAVAHVNRLPILLLPSDVFASRRPDPVLQQVEDFCDGTVTANDCLRPVSRYFDRIARPEQILSSLPRAMSILTDPAACGPVTLALCQDTQAEAFAYPESFFAERIWRRRRAPPDARELADAARVIAAARKPFIIAGGGVHYSDATATLAACVERHGIPVAETQAGKGALPHDHPCNLGGLGVTGSSAANAAAEAADVILAVGTRLQDFTTGSWSLFREPTRRIVCLNVHILDATKHLAQPLVADTNVGLEALSRTLSSYRAPESWIATTQRHKAAWIEAAAKATAASNTDLPSVAQVIGTVQRACSPSDIMVCAAGGLPGEVHKLWNVAQPGGYHLETATPAWVTRLRAASA
jgi:3D-(3,5/4)-trihydroxycyclohexane-1,2-dione acylhydrolase (decyclizing)